MIEIEAHELDVGDAYTSKNGKSGIVEYIRWTKLDPNTNIVCIQNEDGSKLWLFDDEKVTLE